MEAARRLYPQADYEVLPADSSFPPAVFVVRLSVEDIASVQGLNVYYWQGTDTDTPPRSTGSMPVLDTTWPEAAPLSLPFTAEWDERPLCASLRRVYLQIEAPGTVEMALDGEAVMSGTRALSTTQTLAQGNHSLHLRAQGGEGDVKLLWQPPDQEIEVIPSQALFHPPVTANGLLGKYYPNVDWTGAPAMERIDPRLDVYFHLTPLPRPYSVEWTGQIEIPYGGVYQIGVRALDKASVYVDGKRVVETEIPTSMLRHPLRWMVGFTTYVFCFRI